MWLSLYKKFPDKCLQTNGGVKVIVLNFDKNTHITKSVQTVLNMVNTYPAQLSTLIVHAIKCINWVRPIVWQPCLDS